MTPALATPSPLRDGEVELLPVDSGVTALVVAGSHDPEVTRWTQVPEELTLFDAGLITAGWSQPTTTTVRYTVHTREHGAAGIVTVWINAEAVAEVGYWLLAAARGQGIGTCAVRLLCAWSFDACHLDSLQLTTLPGNVASEKVAQACGFHPDGTLVRDIKGRSRTLRRWVRRACEGTGPGAQRWSIGV